MRRLGGAVSKDHGRDKLAFSVRGPAIGIAQPDSRAS